MMTDELSQVLAQLALEHAIETRLKALHTIEAHYIPKPMFLKGQAAATDQAASWSPLLSIIPALVGCLQQDTHLQAVEKALSLLTRLKAWSAVDTLTDIALGRRCAIFKGLSPLEKQQNEGLVRLRTSAIRALGLVQDNRIVEVLLPLLHDKNEHYRIRLMVAETLGRLGDSHAVRPLIELLNDDREKSMYLKESSAKALGLLGDIRALEPLIEALEAQQGILDKFNCLKEQLVLAIGRVANPPLAQYPRAVRNIIGLLNDPAPTLRLAAVEALSELCQSEDIQVQDLLTQRLFDANDDVATAAIAGLYRLWGEDFLAQLLKTQDNLPQFIRDEIESYIP